MNKLKQTLENLLKQEESFVDSETKELNYNKVKDSADKIDKKLIALLAGNKETKDKFFTRIKDVFVFNINDFKFFLDENKIDNSYTQYANKIGLSDGMGLIKDRTDVVLNFPFKDCVLEGGQSTEEGVDKYFEYSDKTKKYEEGEAQRNEIFFNQLLAHDEIDRLFDKKALISWMKFTKKGEGVVKEIKRDKDGNIKENLVIKGNNLLVLHSLKSEFTGKLKLVYLDPPYNTPGEANTFSYNNSFNHSSWLAFMKNRIEIAKELVSEDGFICLAIDDVEYAYLKLLCDDIFGRDNFLATIVVQIKKEGRTDSEFFSTSHDYAIFYCKNKNKAKLNNLNISEENARKWKDIDETGRFYWRDFMRTGGNSTPKDRPNQDYVIYYSKSSNEIVGVGGFSDKEPSQPYSSNIVYTINKDGEFQEMTKKEFLRLNDKLLEFYPVGSKKERQVWRWSDREKVLWASKMGEINLIDNKIKIKDRIREGSKPTTTWYDSEFNATSHGTLLLKKIFNGKKVFSYPKSLFTMIDIINITTNKDKNDIVLDVFGGSATTAHAINRVNKLDKGNRGFIIVEQMDYIQKATIPRIRKSLENESDYFVYFELAKWNEKAKEEIKEAKDLKTLENMFSNLYEKYFLNYNVKVKEFKEKILKEENFKKLTLNEQKKMFLTMLDLNQMYVQESEMADKRFGISKEDQKLTKEFYQNK